MCTVVGMGGLSDDLFTQVRVFGRAHCTCTVLGGGGLSDAPIARKHVCLGVNPVRVRVRCLHGQLERYTDCTYVRGCGSAHCTCTFTVFGRNSLSGTRSVRGCLYLYSVCSCTVFGMVDHVNSAPS